MDTIAIAVVCYSLRKKDDGNIFSEIVSSLIQPRSGSEYVRPSYTSSYTSSRSVDSAYPDTRSSRYTDTQSTTDQYGEVYNEEQENGGFQQEEVVTEEVHDYDEGEEEEEPRSFIERLKSNGYSSGDAQHKRHANSSYLSNSIPSVPPLKRAKPEEYETQTSEDATYDILAVAKDIRNTFGVKSPNTPDSKTPESKVGNFDFSRDADKHEHGDVVFKATSTPTAVVRRTSSKRRSVKHPASPKSLNFSGGKSDETEVNYEIVEVEYHSSDDEGRVPLPESAFAEETSDWNVHDQTIGKLDHIQEYFTGVKAGFDPNISHELNGSMIRSEMDNLPITPDKNQTALHPETSPVIEENESLSPESVNNGSQGSSSAEDVVLKDKKKTGKGKLGKKPNNKSRVEQVKGIDKSSDSDNSDSFRTASESEGDAKGNSSRRKSKSASTTSLAGRSQKNASQKADGKLGIGDKLAKLESMTQEKIRKKSVGDIESKKPVPRFMAGTNSSQSKVRAEAISPNRNLIKDVRDIKKYVRENSTEPVTPHATPVKSSADKTKEQPRKVTCQDIGIQADLAVEPKVIMYTCIHCGNTSDEPVISKPESESDSFADRESQPSENDRALDLLSEKQNRPLARSTQSSSRESLVSNDSYLDDKRYVKSKTAGVTRSYMKGTASSKLKNAVGTVPGEKRKGSLPDTSLNKTAMSKIQQRARAIDGSTTGSGMTPRSKSRPTSPHNTMSFPKLSKSKSVEQMELVRHHIDSEAREQKFQQKNILKSLENKQESEQNENQSEKHTETVNIDKSKIDTKPEIKKSQVQKIKKAAPPPVSPKPRKKPDGKIEVTPLSQRSKPLTSSPSTPLTPQNTPDCKAVESKGQFTRLEENPFIKNDASAVKRQHSIKEKGESVWEKAEIHSKDSSLRRSNSNLELNRTPVSSELRKSNTSLNEKSSSNEKSLHRLSWSGSGSTGSIHKSNPDLVSRSKEGSRSKLTDSNSSLNDAESAFSRTRSVSASSSTSQNTMLNLLNPAQDDSSSQVAIETDVDVAYNSYVKQTSKHDEDSVDKAHLEFAKQALNMLEFETKKRDSSNESEKQGRTEGNHKKGDVNGNVVKSPKAAVTVETSQYEEEPYQRRPSKKEKNRLRKFFNK